FPFFFPFFFTAYPQQHFSPPSAPYDPPKDGDPGGATRAVLIAMRVGGVIHAESDAARSQRSDTSVWRVFVVAPSRFCGRVRLVEIAGERMAIADSRPEPESRRPTRPRRRERRGSARQDRRRIVSRRIGFCRVRKSAAVLPALLTVAPRLSSAPSGAEPELRQ